MLMTMKEGLGEDRGWLCRRCRQGQLPWRGRTSTPKLAGCGEGANREPLVFLCFLFSALLGSPSSLLASYSTHTRFFIWRMESDCQKEKLETNKEEKLFEGDELREGMEVCNEVEAYNLCNSYALKKGFSIRKGNIRRDTKSNIRQRDYLCSKQGFYDDFGQVKTAHKLDTRTGCMARIRFTVEDKVWKISHLNLDHNHECAKPEERQFLKSGRKIRKVHANVMSSMVEAGIRPTKSYSYLAKEVGGAENVGFTKKDCLNYLHRKKEEMIEGGDAESLINHFKYKQAKDPNFFYSVQVDQFTRMTNFFWRDGRSKLDYDCFGDVICFDTTFWTNKYNLICAPFVGINHKGLRAQTTSFTRFLQKQ